MDGFLFVSAYLNVCYLYGFQISIVDYQKRHNGRENNQSYKSDTFWVKCASNPYLKSWSISFLTV